MTRRLLVPAALLAVGLGTWTLTNRFVAWGDGLAVVVGQVATSWTITEPPTSGGIDFIECYGCNNLPGAEGFGLGMLALLLAGGPLAFAARVLERRLQDFGSVGVPAAWCQAGFEEFVHWISVLALVDIVVGIRALSAWRRLQAATFAEPRQVLGLASTA